jgi:hypothetical protein
MSPREAQAASPTEHETLLVVLQHHSRFALGAPVDIGLVKSLAKPDGNMTGIAFEAAEETYAKRLQLLGDRAGCFPRGNLGGCWRPVFCVYGPDLVALGRQGARLVGKVIRGEQPADIPVEQPDRYVMSINLKTARLLGIVVPPSLLAGADEVIE